MIYGLLTALHVLLCAFLIIVVLLQSGKAADLAGAFGGMGSQTAFGPRGSATILSKATTIAAALFMVTSLTLAVMASRGSRSVGSTVLEEQPSRPAQSAPAPSRPNPAAPAQRPTASGGDTGVPLGQPVPMPPLQPPQQAPAKPAPKK
jgi:preprotein translocase subunit SecG